MKEINLYTDGACSKNPGPGGYAAILVYKETEKEIAGFCELTTNNRMELMAVISGITAVKTPCIINVHSDSAYVLNAFIKGWLVSWQKNGWKNSQKKPVENQDLWKLLVDCTKIHKINWIKVKGHSGHVYNERCDELAKLQIDLNVK